MAFNFVLGDALMDITGARIDIDSNIQYATLHQQDMHFEVSEILNAGLSETEKTEYETMIENCADNLLISLLC
jgi:hypothetical protein